MSLFPQNKTSCIGKVRAATNIEDVEGEGEGCTLSVSEVEEIFDENLKKTSSAIPVEAEPAYKALLVALKESAQPDENEDEDLVALDTPLDRIPMDPCTQKEIEDPVRNVVCKHVYDRVGIMTYIQQRAEASGTSR